MSFLGMRGTGDWVSNQRPESWREMVLRLYPNGGAPLTAILSKMSSEKVTDPTFHWWEKALPSQRGTITGIYTDAGLTTPYVSGGAIAAVLYVKMSAADVAHFRARHVVLLVDAGQRSNKVVAKVTAATANGASSYITIKLLEADDNGTARDLSDAAANSSTALVIGTVNEEGAAAPSALAYDPNEKYNYTQIFRNSLDHTRTAMRTKLRTGDQVAEAKRECLELHSMEMERAFIFGIPTVGTGDGGKPERTTGGLKSFLTTNLFDYTQEAGTATWLAGGEDWLDEKLEAIFKYGSREKLGLCGSGAIRGINRLAKNAGTFELTAKTMAYGIQVVEWVTPFGTLYLKLHPLFSDLPIYSNSVAICEPKFMKYRFIDDTGYKPQIQANDIDGEKSEYLTEAGLEFYHEKAHGWLDGVGEDNP